MQTTEFETYAPMFMGDGTYTENPDYDDQLTVFEVPLEWAEQWAVGDGFESLEAFLDNYTWDDTYRMYGDALAQKAVLSERITARN